MERPGGLTVRLDALIWLGLIAAAAGLRLARLDALPLTFDESTRALDALRVSRNSVPEGWDGDLAAALTSYLFRAFEESDLLARMVPAVAGALMVAAAWLWGRSLGVAGALVTGALLGFSPLALLLSRSAEPFGLGALLAVTMTASLFSYLEQPRAATAFLFAVAFGLAPSTDVVATVAAAAVLGFLLLEPVVSRRGAVANAWGVFRRSPSHWLSVALVLAAAAELGITHFGTFVDASRWAGLDQLRDMVEGPRDDRPPEYQIALLSAYDWPVLLAGGLGVLALILRPLRRGFGGLTPLQRFALLWVALAGVVVALASQREAAQLLILVVPLALLAGLLVEELLPALHGAVLRRWWPAPAVALVLLAYAGLIATAWADESASEGERMSLPVALAAAAAVLVGCYGILGRRGVAVSAVVVAVVGSVFLAHSDLSLTSNDSASEFAADLRTADRIDLFRETVGEFVQSRAGPVLINPALREPLAWYLRDLPVTFTGPGEEAGAIVVPLGLRVEGFAPSGGVWQLGEAWYPTDIDALWLWRWLVFREAYGNLDSMESVAAQILVPAP